MKLLSIDSKNFRTLEDVYISFSKNYCAISGKNNSGKSCIIRLVSNLLQRESFRPWIAREENFDYKEDKTQWIDNKEPIKIKYTFELSKNDDSALINFIEKISNIEINSETVELKIFLTVSQSDSSVFDITIDNNDIESTTAKEIVNKLKNSNLLFLHNSTVDREEIYLGIGGRRTFYEIFLSEEERKQLDEASKTVNNKIKRLAKEHKIDLNNLLGRLSDRYDVEFSTLDSSFSRRVPFSINLKDKKVEVPLNDWGSGTQNRTFVLMSILQANRIKTKVPAQDRITPIVIVEEPESFLHPSAQAEFGKLLIDIANELGIQIIVTTHSPYMLNQIDPSSNILLSRNVKRGKSLGTKIIDTSGEKWMAPFADHLGINPKDFNNWRPLFSSYKSKILLVEGDIDKQYFEYFRDSDLFEENLLNDIDIVPYGGKDTLKNTMLVKFVLGRFDKVFITYDLDASKDVEKYLNRLDLYKNKDFIPIGKNQPGKDAIEGLLPNRILSEVNAKETDLVMQMGSQKSKDRKDAKNRLKKLYLDSFKKCTGFSKDELSSINNLIKTINKRFSST